MTIISGGQTGVQQDSFASFIGQLTQSYQQIASGLMENFGGSNTVTANFPPKPHVEKVYVDDGFSNVAGTNFSGSQASGLDDIKTRRISTQEPQLTVYIKKRMWWSLRNENDTKFMDPGEKLFMRASKILFENKCLQIAAYESLTKLSRLVSEDSGLDAERIIAVRDSLQEFSDNVTSAANSAVSSGQLSQAEATQAQVDTLNSEVTPLLNALNNLIITETKLNQNTTTTWVVDPENTTDAVGVGLGVGVIELTSVTNLNTDLSLEYDNQGSIQFSFEDPYNLTKISSGELEIALNAAFQESQPVTNTNGQTFGSDPQQLLEQARSKDQQLTAIRKNRINNLFGLSDSGTLFSQSDSVELVFEIEASSFSKNKVTGSVATISTPFTANTFRIILLQLPVQYQLTSEEDQLVVEIFDLLSRYVAAIERINQAALADNSLSTVQYARRQLRLHYLGKSIVQPMDGVHVFMRGNTFKSGEITGPLGAWLNGSQFVQSFAKDRNEADAVLEEEMKQFGIDDVISVDLYRNLRTGSFMRNAGFHVFGGLISTVSESYSPDRGYIMNVSGASTLKWLNMSRVNLAPSTNQPNGVLEDPLTPYDLNSVLDPGTGLVTSKPSFLDVNQKLIDSGDLHFMTGSKIGQAVKNEADLEQDYFPFGDTTLPVGTHAPGLVYRWKQGVVTVTRNVNLRNALDGTGIASHRLAQEVGISITPQPFSNLDAADVVSLVVTGFPHNYESFLINSQSVGGYNYGSQSNNPESYFHYFFDVTRNTNRALGNFQPYKTYNVSQSQLAQRLSLQTDLQSQSKKLAQLRSQLAQLQDRLNAMNTSPTNISKTDDNLRKISVGGISSDIGAVKAQIALATAAFTNLTKKSGSAGLRVYGNDIALGLETDTTSSDQDAIQQNDKRIRMKNELLQLRSQLKTKFNNDTNLFIVSDDYDKDLDIQAFITDSIASHEIPLWNNTQFQNPFQICVNVAKTLDFEFFCMAEDTIILTMNNNGEIESKFIKDFENNDMVLSISTIDRSVSWKRAKLSKRKLNETEKMFEIRNGRGEIIKLSDNHKILDENLNEVFVKNLKNGDRLATANSLPNIEEDFCLDISSMFTDHKWYKDLGDSFKICGQGSKCKLIPKNIELDVDLSWILGLYVAEGSISDPENRIDKKTRGYHTVFSLNYDEINIAERVKSIIKKKFNIDANIYRYEKYSRCTVDVGSFVFSKIMKSIFGRTTCYNKKVPKIIWRSKNENKLSFLAGVFMGDGTYDRKLSLTSASEQLHNDVSQLFLMLGIENKKSKYRHTLIYGKNNLKIMLPYLSGWKHEEKILKYCNNGNADIKNRKNINNSEIKNITEIKYNSFVYDLEVDDNHTFLINNTWSHNCDTQGHIQFRCPKYNKTPLSLLLKMFLLSKNQNQKLYPPFLDQLFKDRLQAYKDQLNILELNININNILLGRAFIFSSPAANSTIQDEGASVTSSTVIGGLLGADTEQPSGAQLSDRANMLITTRNDLANTIGGTPNIKDPNDAAEVQAAEQEISNLNNPATPNVNSQRLVLINKVADLEAEKQSVTTIVDRLTSQASKYDQSIDGAPQSNQPLSPAQMTEILTPFADLIEDDFNDFLGPGSSKRFTIYDDQIINSTFTESDQNVFCRVDVNGQQDLLGEEPGVLGGIPMIWAGATDFDLWRQYGWRADGAVNKPFFKNAETQCAPYALMLLSRAKRDAVQGSITVYGNEYYQLGDVVYVNCRDLLYYVTSVKHNFDYNAGSFTTTLDLRYGHPLGEYIATPLDVIGKNLIQNQKNFNTKTILRQTATPARGTSLGVILFSSSPQPNEQTGNTTTSPTAEDAFKEMLLGDTGKTNLTTLKNIFTIAKDKIVSGQAFPKLDIRGFVSSDSDDKQRVLNRIAAVQKWFNTPSSAPDQLLSKDYQGFDPSAILTTSDSADPINVKTLQPANVFFGRVPREDVFNVLTTREFTDVIEIVLVNQ